MNTNLLWSRKSTNKFEKEQIREMIETQNIFVSRIQNKKIRDKLIKSKLLLKSLPIVFKFKDKKKGLEEVQKLLDSPSNITGILPGFLRSNKFYKEENLFKTLDIKSHLFDFEAKVSPKLWELNSSPEKWLGINDLGTFIYILF